MTNSLKVGFSGFFVLFLFCTHCITIPAGKIDSFTPAAADILITENHKTIRYCTSYNDSRKILMKGLLDSLFEEVRKKYPQENKWEDVRISVENAGNDFSGLYPKIIRCLVFEGRIAK